MRLQSLGDRLVRVIRITGPNINEFRLRDVRHVPLDLPRRFSGIHDVLRLGVQKPRIPVRRKGVKRAVRTIAHEDLSPLRYEHRLQLVLVGRQELIHRAVPYLQVEQTGDNERSQH